MPDKQLVVRGLQQILPQACVLHDEEDLRPYECDGLSAYRKVPKMVVLPELGLPARARVFSDMLIQSPLR